MRKTTLGLIIFWSILAVLLVVALISGLLFSRVSTNGAGSIAIIGGADGPATIHTSSNSPDGSQKLFDKSYPIDKVKDFKVDLSFDEVDIYPSEGNELQVVQYGINLKDEHVITVDQRGASLSVTRPPRHKAQWFNF